MEIVTGPQTRATRSWLNQVRTGRAKHHLRRWLRTTQFHESLKLGREILEREAKRKRVTLRLDGDLDGLAQQMGYSEGEKLLAAVGAGDLPWQRVIARLEPPAPTPTGRVVDLGRDIYAALMRKRVGGVRIQGVDNLMVRYARCCQPIPGDEVVGVITRGRGVSVHRVACSNLGGDRGGPEAGCHLGRRARSDLPRQADRHRGRPEEPAGRPEPGHRRDRHEHPERRVRGRGRSRHA